MLILLKRRVGRWLDERRLPERAKQALRNDRVASSIAPDPGSQAVIEAGIRWLCLAQDCSASQDSGVARHFSLLTGWGTSYPETTGYIVPTLLDYAVEANSESLRERARRMLDWLVSIQLPEGGFRGGTIDAHPKGPVVFNTGQILIGLARGAGILGDSYRESMRRAADWLVASLDPDGCWRKYPTPFAAPGEKAYDTHAAWGLFEAERIEAGRGYAEAAMRNVRWAMTLQRRNGWIEKCCLSEPNSPLTHTLGYALRGFLEAYRFRPEPDILVAAKALGDGLGSALHEDGFLPGRLSSDWNSGADWSCLTGSSQVAHCWFLLAQLSDDARYAELGRRANAYVRRRIRVQGPEDSVGAVAGSFPINGEYCRLQYPNWATKFTIDANILEAESRST